MGPVRNRFGEGPWTSTGTDMFNVTKKSMQWGGETLTLETGKVARQADGSVIATLGETSVMANVTYAKSAKPGQDFFPLTVHYQERYYAAGKVPGGFFKREARPSEKETLTSRLIDRPIRPLFVGGFKNEVLIICTVLSHDLVNEPDVVAMIAASAALTISGAPFMGPIAACRVGFVDGEYVLKPCGAEMACAISPRMCIRPSLACASACSMIAGVMPATLMSI